MYTQITVLFWVVDKTIQIYLPLHFVHAADSQLARNTSEMQSSDVWELYLLYFVHSTFATFISYICTSQLYA